MFSNREAAGLLLADRLKSYIDAHAIVLAVPRGGVPVASAVARKLNLPLQLVLTKKIGHPANPEYAIGAADTKDFFINAGTNIPEAYISSEVARVQGRLKELANRCCGDIPQLSLKDRTVMIIDDGIATGRTLMASVHLIRKENPAKIIVAVPVAPIEAINSLREVADQVVSLLVPRNFSGVGQFYEDFSQVSDEEVSRLLHQHQSFNTVKE